MPVRRGDWEWRVVVRGSRVRRRMARFIFLVVWIWGLKIRDLGENKPIAVGNRDYRV